MYQNKQNKWGNRLLINMYWNVWDLLRGNVKYPWGDGSQHLATVKMMGLHKCIQEHIHVL